MRCSLALDAGVSATEVLGSNSKNNNSAGGRSEALGVSRQSGLPPCNAAYGFVYRHRISTRGDFDISPCSCMHRSRCLQNWLQVQMQMHGSLVPPVGPCRA